MNAYFDNVRFNNTRYSENARACDLPSRRFGDGFISFICTIVAMVSCPAAVMLEKTAVAFVLFLASISVIGAVEGGMLPMFVGILICGVISLCEYGILKSLRKGKGKTDKA